MALVETKRQLTDADSKGMMAISWGEATSSWGNKL